MWWLLSFVQPCVVPLHVQCSAAVSLARGGGMVVCWRCFHIPGNPVGLDVAVACLFVCTAISTLLDQFHSCV